jgi:putative nucleotidyltransferase with HDIG domain
MNLDPAARRTALTEARDDLAAAALQGVPAHDRTLVVQLLARAFVDAYAAALQPRRPQELVAWVGRMCDAHVDTPSVARFFDAACSSLDDFLAGHLALGAEREPLRALERDVRLAARKSRKPLPTVHERLDETDAAINELIVRLERADPLTAEHSRAVASWCTRLARRLTLSERDSQFVARAGMIHDVGKMTTPNGILQAPRALTDAEWVLMREHTTAGESIVSAHDRLRDLAPPVRWHHERIDGRGYPDRLAAGGLSILIRIVTVADCFNAMIGRRPYRPAMPPAVALEQLVLNRGTQFDPDVVDAMLDVVHQR